MSRYVLGILILLVGVCPLSPSRAHRAIAAPSALPTRPFSSLSRETGELVSRRTRTSRTYQQDGHYVTQISQDSVNYKDASGNWQPIDDSLVPATATGYAEQNKANRYRVSFPSDLGRQPVRVDLDSAWVQFSLVGATGAGTVSGSTDTYSLPGGSIAWTANSDSLKEAITLNSAAAPSTYVFDVAASPGLSAKQNSAGGIDFTDGSGAIVSSFLPPFMSDVGGASTAVSMTLSQLASGLRVTVSADPTWLAAPTRQFPVVIDPTLTTGDTQECDYFNSALPGNSYCTGQSAIATGYMSTNGGYRRGLLKFDLSSIPSGAQVLSADLSLACEQSSNGVGSLVYAYALTSSWTTGATWNSRDGTSTNFWAHPGGDYSTANGVSNYITSAGTKHWYPTAIVQSWINGTMASDGFLLRESIESQPYAPYHLFATSSDPVFSHPSLTISYTPQGQTGAQSYYPMIDHQLTDRMNISVDVTNGNFELQANDLTMPSDTLPIDISRTYNSQSTDTRDIGTKWTVDTAADVGLIFEADGSAIFRGPTSYQVALAKKPDGSFATPPALDSTLVQNGDGSYTLTVHQGGLKYAFSSNGYLTSEVDPTGNSLTFAYNTNGYVTSITDTLGHQTTFTYNTSNLMTQVTDSANRTYLYGYTGNNLTSYTDSAGKVTQYAYDANANLTQITDPNGNITKMTYDASNRLASLLRVTNPSTMAGYTWTFTYNAGNTVATDPNNHAVTYTYDPYGRQTNAKTPLSENWGSTWTSDYHVATSTTPQSETATTSFDGNNNVTQVKLPSGLTQTAAYTNSALPYNPTSVTDISGAMTSIAWNSNGTVASTTDPLNHTSSTTYNANGTPATSTDPLQNTTSYGYTSGLLTSVTPPSPLGGTVVDYNSYNLPWHVTDGAGNTATFTYDVMGRVTAIAYASGLTFSYGYDADGNQLGSNELNGSTNTTYTYQYDALNRVTQETSPTNQSTSYTYDGLDNLLTLTDSGGTITYTYNADSELTAVKDRSGLTTTFSYNADGQETQRTFPSGGAQYTSYDADGNVTKIWATNSAGTTVVSNTSSWTYSPQSSVNTETDLAGNTETTTYNAAGYVSQFTLKAPDGTTTASDTYAYDASGNLTQVDGVSRTFNAADEMTSAGSTSYAYDPAGNLQSSTDGGAYSYDTAERLTNLQSPGASNLTLTPDPGTGEVMQVASGGSTTTIGEGQPGEDRCQGWSARLVGICALVSLQPHQ